MLADLLAGTTAIIQVEEAASPPEDGKSTTAQKVRQTEHTNRPQLDINYYSWSDDDDDALVSQKLWAELSVSQRFVSGLNE